MCALAFLCQIWFNRAMMAEISHACCSPANETMFPLSSYNVVLRAGKLNNQLLIGSRHRPPAYQDQFVGLKRSKQPLSFSLYDTSSHPPLFFSPLPAVSTSKIFMRPAEKPRRCWNQIQGQKSLRAFFSSAFKHAIKPIFSSCADAREGR